MLYCQMPIPKMMIPTMISLLTVLLKLKSLDQEFPAIPRPGAEPVELERGAWVDVLDTNIAIVLLVFRRFGAACTLVRPTRFAQIGQKQIESIERDSQRSADLDPYG